jgi:DNA replication protein DnaC
MNRDLIMETLSRRTLKNADFDRLTTFYNLSSECPTCGGRKKYVLDGTTHDCDCEIQRLLQKHYYAANIPKRYHDICIDQHFVGKDRDEVLSVVTNYLDRWEDMQHFGLGLTFAGGYGTGKTFALCSILKALLQRGEKVYFITFDELINVWGASWSDEEQKRTLTDSLLSAAVLGLDELKTDPRNAQGFLQNGLDNVIRHRTSNRLPTLITTNMLPAEEEREFPKVFSLLSESNTKVYLTGKDIRADEVAKTTSQLAAAGERRPIC